MSCPGKDLPQKPSNDTLYYFILLNAISSIPGFYSKYTPITLSKKRKETTKDFLTCSSLKLSRLLLPFSLPGIWPHSLLQGKSLKDFCNFSLPPNQLSLPWNSHSVQLMCYSFQPVLPIFVKLPQSFSQIS